MAVPILLVMILIVLTSCSFVIADGDDRGPTPTIAARLDPATQEAKVTQSQLDNVTFQGTVEIEQPSVTTSDLNLNAIVNTGWPITLSPSYFTVTGPTTVTFQVDVIVPPGTSSLQTGNLVVKASLKAPLLADIECEASAIVLVGQYYKARIVLDNPIIVMEDGQERTTSGAVWNDGNGKANFQLSVTDVPAGIEVSLGSQAFRVNQDEHHPFSIRVRVEDGVGSGQYEMMVRVVCLDGDGNLATEKEYPLTVRVPSAEIGLPAPGPSIWMAITVLILVVAIKVRGDDRGGR